MAVTASGVGGIVLGVVAARNHRQRRGLRQRTDQATLLNRRLRHELLNGLAAIRGYTDLLTDGGTAEHDPAAVVQSADRIEPAVEDVRFLSPAEDQPIPFGGQVALDSLIEECRAQLEDIEAPIAFRVSLREIRVRADEHLQTVLCELVPTAATCSSESRIVVDATAGRRTVSLSVSAPGEWLSKVERAALLDGPPKYDDPRLDYGLSIVRLLVARYGGRIALTTDEERVTVEVTRLRTSAEAPSADNHGLGLVDVSEAVVVGLIAAVAMGLVGQSLSGTMGVVRSFYGGAAPVLGWTVHLFHSSVFAIVAAMAWHHESLQRYVGTPVGAITAGAASGLLLWIFAGSVLMPLWLSLLVVSTPIADFDAVSLLAHLVWGLSIRGLRMGNIARAAVLRRCSRSCNDETHPEWLLTVTLPTGGYEQRIDPERSCGRGVYDDRLVRRPRDRGRKRPRHQYLLPTGRS